MPVVLPPNNSFIKKRVIDEDLSVLEVYEKKTIGGYRTPNAALLHGFDFDNLIYDIFPDIDKDRLDMTVTQKHRAIHVVSNNEYTTYIINTPIKHVKRVEKIRKIRNR